ncbi:GNAT family N-acetyltransferase [Candidatus Woesearchaeota archaeon]|nr:GNAT family N-acetyltransferase [Candidatus Woesearchaeota archaeon]
MIKELSKNDVNEVATLLRRYWSTRGMKYSQKWTLDYLKKGHKIELKKEKFFVLKEKEIMGYISILIWEGNLAELRDLVVKEEYKGKNYGKQLVNHALTWCKNNKIRKVMALSFPKYKKFIEKFGFRQEGYLKDHFTEGEDLLFMSLKLK